MRTKKARSAPAERLTITLGQDQRRRISIIARERRTSEASIIRWAVDEYIAAHAQSAPEAALTRGTRE